MIDPRLERLANLVTEAGFRQRDPLARDELAVEPGSTNRCDLSFDREIRSGCEGEPPLSTDVDSPDLDESADGRRELQVQAPRWSCRWSLEIEHEALPNRRAHAGEAIDADAND
jgi:hypothetical protein